MSLRHLILLLVLTVASLAPSVSLADRAFPPHDLYQRTSRYYGHPPTYPRQATIHKENTWYKWGYFGAYPTQRTMTGGHYSHRNHYTELRFSAPR